MLACNGIQLDWGFFASVLVKLSQLLLSTVSLVLSRLCLLFAHIVDFLFDIGWGDMKEGVVGKLWGHMKGLNASSWESLFHDSTSPMPRQRSLDPELLTKGLWDIGMVEVPPHIWEEVIPESFEAACQK
uniref:Uncharacterized protein n=1 Tax=Eutreptiella gymnastica TaxID=73025 RepID=A0A7S1JF52_9EUGL